MKINAAGVELVKRFEGCELTSYLCPTGVPTIGYGSTKGVKLGVTITLAEADRLLREDLAEAGGAIARWAANNHTTLDENEFAALVSFAFNIGATGFTESTVAKKLRAGDRKGAANAFGMWIKGDGVVLPGLVARRSEEKKLFLTKVGSVTTSNFTLRFKVSSLLKLLPIDSSKLMPGTAIAFPKGAELNVAAIALEKENGHHLLTLGKVNGKQLEYLGKNTLWVFHKDVEIAKGGKLFVNNPIDSIESGLGADLFILSVGNVTCDTPIISESSGGGFLTWGMATHNGERIPNKGNHVDNMRAIALVFEQKIKPVLRKHTQQDIQITSWYRPEPFNSRAGGVSNSAHLDGKAIDFWVDPLSSIEVYKIFDSLWRGGFGYYSNGISHADVGGDRRWQL